MRFRGLVPAFVLAAVAVAAQPAGRVATTPEALVTAAVFFHGRQVAIRHQTVDDHGFGRVDGTTKPIYVFRKDEGTTTGPDQELRGEFWDLGRLQQNDSRLTGIDVTRLLQTATNGEWPARDSLFVLLNATAVDSPLPTDPTIRSIALAPEHYENSSVTIVGRFRGANLYGDLPQPVAKSRWDFVLQSADAAIWVTNLRPRGKGFDLDIGSRIDTGKWLKISGTVHFEGVLPWIEATTVALATAPADANVEAPAPVVPKEPPAHVIFTAPIANDIDVAPNTPVRIQFSRDMDPASFKGHIRVSYITPATQMIPEAPPAFTFSYNEGNRALEIKFPTPLKPHQTVKVELLEGIQSAVDHQPMAAPWSMLYSTGG